MKPRRLATLLLSLIMLIGTMPTMAFALSGEAEYTPAESNISMKYWVSFDSGEGTAEFAKDGNLETAWTWTPGSTATLLVDLGGAYNEIHKIETIFADSTSVYQYTIEGSKDGSSWVTLADRTDNNAFGANFTDLISFPGLCYLRLTVKNDCTPGVKEFRVINYLRRDMRNGSDSSGVNMDIAYNYDLDSTTEGIRGGTMTEESMNTGENYFGLVKDLGWDITRLRIWNEPRSEGGWANGAAANVNEAIDLENPPEVGTNCSPDTQKNYAKYIVGAGQELAIDFHYADSWCDPQNQPKPYAWAELPFDQLVDKVYEFTHDYIEQLINQGTAPTIVAIGNEITNGMMWGSEYLLVNEHADYHDYYKRFIRDNSAENMNDDGTTKNGRLINPNAQPGGGVKWLKYDEANGNTDSAAYQEFVASVKNLATLVDAGNRAIADLNEAYNLDIQTEMHFAFNVIEEDRATGEKIPVDADYVFEKVTTLVGLLADDLDGMGGMVNRIGLSYYPDWHGTYDQVQRNMVELSKMLPDVAFNISECSPAHSGTVNSVYDNPNFPVGTVFNTQIAGDISIDIMKTINDVPNNVGKGVWPWNGHSVYGVGAPGGSWWQPSANNTLQASFKAWNDAFAKNVVESDVSAITVAGEAPVLPKTVKSLDIATGTVTDVAVTWDSIAAADYSTPHIFTVSGTADVTVPTEGRGKAMDAVTATVTVVSKMPALPTPPTPPTGPSSGGVSTAPIVPAKPTEPTGSKTEILEDGSKVTTVTDANTGTVTVTTEKPDGTKEVVETRRDGAATKTVTTKDGDVTITVTDEKGDMLAKVTLPAEIPTPQEKFVDLDQASWAESAIYHVAGLGMVQGVGNGKYAPAGPMTRGALATILFRLSHGNTTYSMSFKDVAADKYYAGGIAWAAHVNVVTGINENTFAPDRAITREQLAVMLTRYAKLLGVDTTANARALDQFSDGGAIQAWSADSLAWCVENGILNGRNQGTLDPKANVTRAEVAVMLDRFISLLK